MRLPVLLALLAGAEAEGGEAAAADGRGRPYDVLRAQNLVLLGSVLGILLVVMVLMAVCVYKPLRRR